MTPSEARSALASALDGAGLSATQKAQIRPAIDDYAASLVEACARSPRDLGITPEPRRDTAQIRRWAVQAGIVTAATGPVRSSAVREYDSAHRSTG